MARYRTIKPSFWTSGQISRLPKPTALFFISLWTFAEDDGVISSDPRTLSLQVPIFRSQDIEKMLMALWKEGLIKRSPSDGLVLITGWAHQKIDKPRVGRYKTKEIQWLEYSDSTNGRDRSTKVRRKESRVEESKVRESKVVVPAPETDASPVKELIARYCELWKARYNTQGSFSGKWAGNAKTLVKDHGLQKSIKLVEAFLEMNDQWFLTKRHAFDLIITDLAKISHFAGTGVQVSQTQIRQADRTLGNANSLQQAKDLISKRHGSPQR